MIYWNRFISYIFRYHNYEKCENAGFLKVQKQQNEMGKMQVSVKDVEKKEGIYSVYLYRETLAAPEEYPEMKAEGMVPVLLYLGKCAVKSGRGWGTFTFDWNDIHHTGRPVMAWSGVILKPLGEDSGDLFCSSWTDSPVDYSHTFEEKPEQKMSSLTKAQKATEMGQAYEQIKDQTQADAEVHESDMDETDLERDEADNSERRVTAAELLASMKNESRAAELFANREKLPLLPNCPNGESGIVECVKIDPNDIGLLDMENWRLGVNSFLTHGFYSYRYLMLGRVLFDEEDTNSYILGVPGEYSAKEKYLAGIFGFDRFLPAKETQIKTGSFGYWVVDLK